MRPKLRAIVAISEDLRSLWNADTSLATGNPYVGVCFLMMESRKQSVIAPPSQRQSIRGKFAKVRGRSAIHLWVSLRVEIGIGDISLVDDWFVGRMFDGLGFAKDRVHRSCRGIRSVVEEKGAVLCSRSHFCFPWLRLRHLSELVLGFGGRPMCW